MDSATPVSSTIAGDGQCGFSGDGGPATSAELSAGGPVAVDSAGNLFISDGEGGRIREVVASKQDQTISYAVFCLKKKRGAALPCPASGRGDGRASPGS